MLESQPLRLLVRLLRPGARLPAPATPGSAGLDLHACPPADQVEIGPDPVLVPTGIAIEIPPGFEAQVRPRSGLSSKGVMVALGTVDSDYRGEVLVTMYTTGTRAPHVVRHGDRVAQLVVAPVAAVTVVEAAALSSTARGSAGHGSTGA